MVRISLILLIVMIITLLAPVSLCLQSPKQTEYSLFVGLDVCHSAAPALSSNGDMPCVHAIPNSVDPIVSMSTNASFHPIFSYPILSSRTERPPQA